MDVDKEDDRKQMTKAKRKKNCAMKSKRNPRKVEWKKNEDTQQQQLKTYNVIEKTIIIIIILIYKIWAPKHKILKNIFRRFYLLFVYVGNAVVEIVHSVRFCCVLVSIALIHSKVHSVLYVELSYILLLLLPFWFVNLAFGFARANT